MANTAYTDKQLADHLAAFERGEGLPENSVLDFKADPILRKMTPEEVKNRRVFRPAYVRPDRVADLAAAEAKED